MEKKELYKKLKEAYSDKNLNQITGKLIDLYKTKNYCQIRTIANRISKYVPVSEESDTKRFSRLIMMYHPDKGEMYRKAIDKASKETNLVELESFSHILLLEKVEFTESAVFEDVDFDPDYEFDSSQGGFSYIFDSEEEYKEQFDQDSMEDGDYEKNFYNAVKIRIYGNLNTEFPSYYLNDFDDMEFSGCFIEHLDGIEYCKHALTLDLSSNHITDITLLWELTNLQEVYLSNNHIGYIDALSNLLDLRIVDLSGNEINDITPLLHLEHLEYVNLIGNRIPSEQIDQLRKKDVLVMV